MPTLTIDGKSITVEPRTTVIQAADRLGIHIPRFCYHPGLSTVGSCRMCMVEIEKIPKLQTACATPVVEGMVVYTDTDHVRDARRSILEFLLINHPIDCPVCDKAGECFLQDYYMDYGLYTSRYLEERWRKRKVFVLGSTIVMDEERCVLCSRCVRFFEEVPKVRRLGIFQRGADAILSTCPGETLEDPYCGNIVDLCPVGALTDRDFRFQQRVWLLKQGDSICPYCARGCNIIVDYNEQSDIQVNDRRVYRFRPRYNPNVNGHWMCDMGRYGYRTIDAPERIEEPLLREGKRLTPVGWENVLKRAALRIREVIEQKGPEGIGLIVHPSVSCETALMANLLFIKHLGIQNVSTGPPVDPSEYEDPILIRRDRYPNRKGLAQAGFTSGEQGSDLEQILKAWGEGKIRLLYVIGDELPRLLNTEKPPFLFGTEGILILQKSTAGPEDEFARMILPAAMPVEEEGTFVNFEGRAQHYDPVVAPFGESLPSCEILMRLSDLFGLKLGTEHWEPVSRNRRE